MAVVINEFEVLDAPQPEPPAASPQPAAAPAPTPEEIELIVRRQSERAARVRAD